jgi:hypothetical protein
MAGVAQACDGDPNRIGLRATESGNVVVHFSPCRFDKLVKDARVYRVAVARAGAGVRFKVVWEIKSESPEGSGLLEYTVGQTPSGFVETVSLEAGQLQGPYVAIVDSSLLIDQRLGFDTDKLRVDRVFTPRYLTTEEMRNGAVCD